MIFSSLLVTAATTAANPTAQQPNIIVFLVDDMGLMDTSVPFLTDEQGLPKRHPLNEWYRTPNMERLAERGVRFTNFYAQSVSSPSRASLMTGQNATRHRTTNWINSESNNRDTYGPYLWNWRGIAKGTPTLPMKLQEAGYKTIHIGKAHFGCNDSNGADPHRIGFEVNIAGSSIGEPGSYYSEWGYGHKKGRKERAVPDLEKYHDTGTFLTDALTLEAKKEIQKAVQEKRPFYLNMAHYAVHNPFQVDKRFLPHYEKDSLKGDSAKAYATLIEGMDKSLGDLMDEVQRLGIAENTLIIFLGDNGGDAPLGDNRGWASSAPLRGRKGAEYEGGMRVPFIAAWAQPQTKEQCQQRLPIVQGGVQQQIGTIMDIYPTLINLAGTTLEEDYPIDGYNLDVQFSGKENPERPNTFLMHFPHEHRGNYFTIYRSGDWKVIYYYHPEAPETASVALYNLKDDPEERDNVAEREPARRQKMLREMIAQLKKEGALYPVDKNGKEVLPRIL